MNRYMDSGVFCAKVDGRIALCSFRFEECKAYFSWLHFNSRVKTRRVKCMHIEGDTMTIGSSDDTVVMQIADGLTAIDRHMMATIGLVAQIFEVKVDWNGR